MAEIRHASLGDHDQILDLFTVAELGKMTEDEWDAIIASPSTVVFVTEEDQAVIGAAIASFDGWRAYIYHLALAPGHRRQGLAKALMAEAEGHLAREGARRVYVMVHEENTAGLALCAVLGYAPEGDVALVKELSE